MRKKLRIIYGWDLAGMPYIKVCMIKVKMNPETAYFDVECERKVCNEIIKDGLEGKPATHDANCSLGRNTLRVFPFISVEERWKHRSHNELYRPNPRNKSS